MSVKVRLHGTQEACRQAAERIAAVLRVLPVSGPYPDRRRSVLVRVYIEAELPAGQPGEPDPEAER